MFITNHATYILMSLETHLHSFYCVLKYSLAESYLYILATLFIATSSFVNSVLVVLYHNRKLVRG